VSHVLRPGDAFPAITVAVPGGGQISLPDTLHGSFGVVLFYRGSWCPYCNGQLRAFQRARETFEQLGVKVVALSVDDEATTQALIDKLKLTYPVGHSADAKSIAAATGAFVNDDPEHLQSTGFVLDPEGGVIVAVYSNGAIGRLVPEDVAGLIRYVKEHAAQ